MFIAIRQCFILIKEIQKTLVKILIFKSTPFLNSDNKNIYHNVISSLFMHQ
ncbi:hypothetical protein PUATCC27989T_03309 [Phytobacter ursingii]|nr:hypothetical protein PUATCC27989T_03309 [Phytobacter ursingii]